MPTARKTTTKTGAVTRRSKAPAKAAPKKQTADEKKAAAAKLREENKKKDAAEKARAAERKAKQKADEAAAREKKKAAREAEKVAKTKAADEAKAAKAKIAKEAEVKLASKAREINIRLEKAAKLEGDADNHRIAAAYQLAAAKSVCEEAGISFQKWSEANVIESERTGTKLSYSTVRFLARIGAADDPHAALQESREKNREANKKHREAKGAISGTPTQGGRRKKDAEASPMALPSPEKLAEAVTEENASEVFEAAVEAVEKVDLATVQAVFAKLSDADKVKFCEWAAKETKGEYVSEFDLKAAEEEPVTAEEETDLLDVPEFLRRKK